MKKSTKKPSKKGKITPKKAPKKGLKAAKTPDRVLEMRAQRRAKLKTRIKVINDSVRRKIIKDYDSGKFSQRLIASRYGVTQPRVSYITRVQRDRVLSQ